MGGQWAHKHSFTPETGLVTQALKPVGDHLGTIGGDGIITIPQPV